MCAAKGRCRAGAAERVAPALRSLHNPLHPARGQGHRSPRGRPTGLPRGDHWRPGTSLPTGRRTPRPENSPAGDQLGR
ncbi:hypothetical protein FAGKG844_20247 [Frankia sp. AgKG'84/4]